MFYAGHVCPTCKLVVPVLRAPGPSRKHSETSHLALESSATKFNERCKRILAELRNAGPMGMTDDELEALLGGGTSVAPCCTMLRKARLIGWTLRADGKPFRRLTRRGCDANVNVLAEFVEEPS